tara:strand:+ start:1427 stop:1765 length:339 start_codon:yes stop_codon:yes gene_type:complete
MSGIKKANKENYTFLDPDLADPLSFPDYQEWYQPGIFDVNIPIHPDYIEYLKPSLGVGDLVETYAGEVGIVTMVDKPERYPALRIKGANNVSYVVLIDEEEKTFIGYSLKKI